MEFMDMLREWLDLRDRQNAEEDNRPINTRHREQERMTELEEEIGSVINPPNSRDSQGDNFILDTHLYYPSVVDKVSLVV